MTRVEQRDGVARFLADAAFTARHERKVRRDIAENNKAVLRTALDASVYVEWLNGIEAKDD